MVGSAPASRRSWTVEEWPFDLYFVTLRDFWGFVLWLALLYPLNLFVLIIYCLTPLCYNLTQDAAAAAVHAGPSIAPEGAI